MTSLTPEREQEPYRDDVREALEVADWRENENGCVVADNGALWTETNDNLDSGIDAPDKTWSVSFDSGVPSSVIVAAALAAGGTDVPALLAEIDQLRGELAETRKERDTARANAADEQREMASMTNTAAALVARPTRAEVLREAEDAVTHGDLGPTGGCGSEDYDNGWWNSRHAAAERVRRLANAAERDDAGKDTRTEGESPRPAIDPLSFDSPAQRGAARMLNRSDAEGGTR